MPGHGHQDCGAFELHHAGRPVFVDPGRGTYGETGDAAFYRSARVHNTLIVDSQDPFPPNKPYFDDVFRRRISGPPPELSRTDGGVRLVHRGFSRLGSVGAVRREWSFDENSMAVTDQIEGSGTRMVERILCTTLEVTPDGDALILKDGDVCFSLRFDDGAIAQLENGVRWTAYGEGQPATFIRVAAPERLPFQGRFCLTMAKNGASSGPHIS